MKTKTFGIVMVHEGVEDVIARHYPVWKDSVDELMLFSPADSIPKLNGLCDVYSWGVKGHHGRAANERFRHVIQLAAKCLREHAGYGRVILHEYDSLCIGPIPDTPEVCLAGNEFKDFSVGRPFAGNTYIHPPIIIWHKVLFQLAELLEVENMNGESGFWDRFLGYVCERHRIPIYSLREHGLGYSQNTIAPEQFIEVRTAKINGARLFHGIKTEEAFKVAISRPSRRGGRAWVQSR